MKDNSFINQDECDTNKIIIIKYGHMALIILPITTSILNTPKTSTKYSD